MNSLYWENECLRLQLSSLVLLQKTSEVDNVSLQQIFKRIPLLNYRYFASIPCDFVPIVPNESFAIKKTQPSDLQGDHWIMNTNCCHKLYFADSFGRPSFLKQHYAQMTSEPLEFHRSVCSFYTIFVAFHLFNFRQEINTGVDDVNALPFIS